MTYNIQHMEIDRIIKGNNGGFNYYVTAKQAGQVGAVMGGHDIFRQKSVSLAAQLGGASRTEGCMTQGAEAARRAAEDRFLRSQDISHPKNIYRDN